MPRSLNEAVRSTKMGDLKTMLQKIATGMWISKRVLLRNWNASYQRKLTTRGRLEFQKKAREGLQDCSKSTNRFSNKAGEIPTSQGITYEGKTEGKLLADTSEGARIFGGAARILGCISKEAGRCGIL